MKKAIFAITLFICILLSFAGCASHPLEGRYHLLSNEFGEDSILVLKAKDENSGTFETYDEDGTLLNKSNKRYTWTLEEDIITLTQSGSSIYLYVTGNALIAVDEEGKTELYDYVAPKGKRFDWECKGYTFSEDGTYTYRYDYGKYYVKNNTIFIASEDEEEYKAKFYIYDGDYIADAMHVFLR